MSFKNFLITENTNFLGQRVGDILTAVQELKNDSGHMGTRDLNRFSERIVNQIRKILHSQWDRSDKKYLLVLQKVAVAIMNGIDKNADLKEVISAASSELENLSGKIGLPINKFAKPDSNEPESSEGTDDSENSAKSNFHPSPAPVASPGSAELQQSQPPLGGNSGPLSAF